MTLMTHSDYESIPPFLKMNEKSYRNWLNAKARQIANNDKKRFSNNPIAKKTQGEYKKLIHDALAESNGKDIYTGCILNFNLIGQSLSNSEIYANAKSYPSFDHIFLDGRDFKLAICSLKINDIKGSSEWDEILDIIKPILRSHGYIAASPEN